MRARGAKATDIAVLVVAADDGVMPQTKESISHARAAEVPIVVAVNKVDLPDANPDKVKNELASEGLQPEEWGGTTQFSEVSAREKQNLDDLLEKVLLVADAELELKANPKAEASGPIVESRLDVGRGPVATMLIHRGTLNVGDAIVAGDAWGRVRALYDFHGEKLKHAGPGDPVEIVGFDKPPPAGEHARVVENERQARQHAQARGERLRREQLAQRAKPISLDVLFERVQEGVQDLNIVLKADVAGSVEAALSELQKIEHTEVRVSVIHSAAGGITENDVMLASASNAMVVGFNVRPNAGGAALAEREGVEIRTYRVIYQLTEDIEQALVGMLQAGLRGGHARRGRGARADPDLPLRHDRRLVRHERHDAPRRERAHHPRRRDRPRDDDRLAQALQGRRARGHRGLRVRHPPRRLRRRQGRRRARGLRGARGGTDGPRRGAARSTCTTRC